MITPPRFYVGVTDQQWFDFLRMQPSLDEVNFWSPGTRMVHLERGTPFLFKLKAPQSVIGGLGYITFLEKMPIRDAWESFRFENGVSTLEELVKRIGANRVGGAAAPDDVIGCRILSQPTFFTDPIPQPEDWPPSTQSGKGYSMEEPVAQRVWRDVSIALSDMQPSVASGFGGYGQPGLRPTRIGQGAFRKLVLDAYGRRCAVSGEHTVPVLQASHIKPFADVEQHEITNGLSLRSDIHTLFDRGYVTVTPDYRFLVSEQLREDYDNGEVYYEYARQRATIILPTDRTSYPNRDHLDWHSREKFKA